MPPATIDLAQTMSIIDDFTELDPARWTSGNDGSTVTDSILNLPGGWLSMPTDAGEGDNSYRDRTSPAAIFQPAQGRAIYAECVLKLTEANGNKAGIWFGLTDTDTVGFLTDGSYNPPAVFDGFVFYKQPNSSVWKFIASNGTTRQVLATAGAFISGAETTLRLQLSVDKQGTEVSGVTYSVLCVPILNGIGVLSSGVRALQVPLASLSPMRLGFGVKAGSASVETLLIDSVAAWQSR